MPAVPGAGCRVLVRIMDGRVPVTSSVFGDIVRLNMLPLLRMLSVLPLILAGRRRRDERRIVDWFRARGALDAGHAVTVDTDGTIAAWIRRRLTVAAVLCPIADRFYFDEAAYLRFRARRRWRALIVVTVFIAAIEIAMLTGVVTL